MNFLGSHNLLPNNRLFKHNMQKQNKIYKKKSKRYIAYMIPQNGSFLVNN